MEGISANASIAWQAALLALSFAVLIARAYNRVAKEKRRFGLADYLAFTGWIFTLGWFVTTIISYQLGVVDDVDYSVPLLKLLFASNYFFDIGLFFPKFSVLVFYWNLIPTCYPTMRKFLYVITGYVVCACICTFFLDTLWCLPVSNNWSLEFQSGSVWNSWDVFNVNYAFNLSTDLSVLILPFFLLKHLRLPLRQKYGLAGIFSLGLITIIISVSRYVWENLNLSVTSGNVWCTAEMSTALIVVSLPSLKSWFMGRSRSRENTSQECQQVRSTETSNSSASKIEHRTYSNVASFV